LLPGLTFQGFFRCLQLLSLGRQLLLEFVTIFFERFHGLLTRLGFLENLLDIQVAQLDWRRSRKRPEA
jgi:hypothetical protein